jgi:hypothetical protein
VTLNGRPISAYNRAFVSAGRVFAPVRPFVTALSDRTWIDGNRLEIVRDGRRVSVLLRDRAADRAYVPLAEIARELGARVEYCKGQLDIRTAPRAAITAPTPLPAAALVSPRNVFTPMPLPTPKPVWSGPALPRRTPLPYASQPPALLRGERSQILRTMPARVRLR